MKTVHSRDEVLDKIEKTSWDVVVIGGGITGAGILRESTRHGLKALLLEQKDFAWGTSSRSTKMVHGGLRYLKEGNIGLTRESVIERENLIKELPGLVEEKTFIIPAYKGKLSSRLALHAGLIIYDILSGKWRRHSCSFDELRKRVPSIGGQNLKGGFFLKDAVTDDARLVLRVLKEAINEGASALNYCKVTSLVKNNHQVDGVEFENSETGMKHKVSGRIVINATGAWADRLRSQITKKNNEAIRPLRGSHIILPAERLPLIDNVSIIHPNDKRPVIALKWEGRILMGTTDIDHQANLDQEAAISNQEVDYLLEALNFQFPNYNFTRNDIISTQAGIRPVVNTGKKNPSQESRDHVIWEEEGLLTVTGGKMTTFRVIAQDALKKAQSIIGTIPDLDAKKPIFSKSIDSSDYPNHKVTPEIIQRLIGRYGEDARQLIEKEPGSQKHEVVDGTETLWSELPYVSNEMIVHLDDLMLRRTRLGLLQPQGGKSLMPKIKSIVQPLLNWDDEKWSREESRYLKIWNDFYSVPE